MGGGFQVWVGRGGVLDEEGVDGKGDGGGKGIGG